MKRLKYRVIYENELHRGISFVEAVRINGSSKMIGNACHSGQIQKNWQSTLKKPIVSIWCGSAGVIYYRLQSSA